METREGKRRIMLTLFLTMVKLGFIAFGGGWSVVGMMEQEYCDRLGWISREELLDYVALGRSFPGIMIMNISTSFGYRIAGVSGALVATVGLALPSILVIAVVTVFYDKIRDNLWVDRALIGVRAAVVPIVISALVKLRSSALTGPWTLAAAAAAAALCYATTLPSTVIVVGGVALGLLSGAVLRRKGDEHAAGS